MLSLFSFLAKWSFTASRTLRRVANRDSLMLAGQVQVLHPEAGVGRVAAQAERARTTS